MTMTMTRGRESTLLGPRLLVAFELSERTWKLGFTIGRAQRPRLRSVPAGAVDRLLEEVRRAKERFGLRPDAAVLSCYEAGREGFWLHRWAVAQGWTNLVVDSSSIEVNRRARRAKTDGLDLAGLLRLLDRHAQGEDRVWRVVRVPSEGEEDARQLHRLRETLQQERTRMINRLRGLLTTQGVEVPLHADFVERLATVRRWDGTPVPPGLTQRLRCVWAELQFLTTQLAEVDAARAALPVDRATEMGRWVERLQTLRGIGATGAWSLTTEIFGWRQIRNGRELGALVGVVPAPYTRALHEPAIGTCGAWSCSSRGVGCAISRRAR